MSGATMPESSQLEEKIKENHPDQLCGPSTRAVENNDTHTQPTMRTSSQGSIVPFRLLRRRRLQPLAPPPASLLQAMMLERSDALMIPKGQLADNSTGNSYLGFCLPCRDDSMLGEVNEAPPRIRNTVQSEAAALRPRRVTDENDFRIQPHPGSTKNGGHMGHPDLMSWKSLMPDDEIEDSREEKKENLGVATLEVEMSSSQRRKEKRQEKVVRSVLEVQGICCASEVPCIRRIVRPLQGVVSLQVNITSRQVYVQHNGEIISAAQLGHVLGQQGFPARVLKDGHRSGGVELFTDIIPSKGAADDQPLSKTTIRIHRILHDDDVVKIQQVVRLSRGVRRVHAKMADSVLYIEHDNNEPSSESLQQTLCNSGYPCSLILREAVPPNDPNSYEMNELWRTPRSSFVESTIFVSNLTKMHVPLLKKVVQQQYIRTQIRAIHPHVASQMVKVEHNPDKVTLGQLCTVFNQYGLDAQAVTDGGVERAFLPLEGKGLHYERGEATHDKSFQSEQWDSGTLKKHVIVSGIFWVVSMLSAFGGKWKKLQYAGLLSVIFGLPPVAMKACRTLRRMEFDANCMMVVAAVGALALNQFDEAASVAFLFAVSEFLESRASTKARKALSEIVNLRPEYAHLIHPGTNEIIVVPAEMLPVGSIISVRTGDKIAADGVVIEGTSSVDESSLTGESIPVRKTIDSLVSGGSINIGSTRLIVRTTCTVEDSTVSRLIRLVEEAQANRSPMEKIVDRFARAYTPLVLFLAFAMATIPWIEGKETGRYWTLNALIIVVIACPCALTISTPVTYGAGLAATAKRGIIVKGGASLEALGSVEKVLLDKTGTITEGKFAVVHLEAIGETRTRRQMLTLLSLMEAPSSHPLSATLIQAAKREGVLPTKDIDMREHTILKGEGVTAQVDGKQVYVGNRHLFERIGMYGSLSDKERETTEGWSNDGGTVGFLGVEGEGIIGCFSMTDQVRSEAKEAIESLQFAGIEVVMLTGDSAGAAKSVAKQLGIAESAVYSQLMPEDKLHFVGSFKAPRASTLMGALRKRPNVLFCGDGVNDGPALAAADVGVSMGEGAALALEMSDMTLMDSNLTKLVYALNMGMRVMYTVRENIFLSLVCKLAVVALTFGGYMTLLYAIGADVGVMLLVTLNGMKLLPGETSLVTIKPTSCWNRKYQSLSAKETDQFASGTSSPDCVSAVDNDIL